MWMLHGVIVVCRRNLDVVGVAKVIAVMTIVFVLFAFAAFVARSWPWRSLLG
jgi:hypothetical protein